MSYTYLSVNLIPIISYIEKIDEYGFVELSKILPKGLIKQIREEASTKVNVYQEQKANMELLDTPRNKRKLPSDIEVEEISNALQMNVTGTTLEQMKKEIERCVTTRITMKEIFGKVQQSSSSGEGEQKQSHYTGFTIDTPKVLVTPPGSNPQLPHADDHCTSCGVVLIHLKNNQEPTRVAKYEGNQKDYPTGITVTCDSCGRDEMLPDSDYRRGVHVTNESWYCDCKGPHKPYDLGKKITEAFGELLDEAAPASCDSYCGPVTAKEGSGVICLPQLIHRGPGNPTSAKESRYILFFTLTPQYESSKPNIYHRYNPNLQIHAPCILFNKFEKVKQIYEQSGCSLDGYMSAFLGKTNASLMGELAQLKEENKQLRKEAGVKSRPKKAAAVAPQKKSKPKPKQVGVNLPKPKPGYAWVVDQTSVQSESERWNCQTCGYSNAPDKSRCCAKSDTGNGRCMAWRGGARC